jgi:hypothetical protein
MIRGNVTRVDPHLDKSWRKYDGKVHIVQQTVTLNTISAHFGRCMAAAAAPTHVTRFVYTGNHAEKWMGTYLKYPLGLVHVLWVVASRVTFVHANTPLEMSVIQLPTITQILIFMETVLVLPLGGNYFWNNMRYNYFLPIIQILRKRP